MKQAARRIVTEPDDGRYRLLVDAITDYAIYMLDVDGTVTSWNAGAERFKGYTAAEILGQHFSRFYTDEDRAAGMPAAALRTAAAEGRFEKEGWRVRKDGTRFWAQVIIDPVREPSGEVIGYAKITRDLTERREAQRALEQAQHALLQSQKLESIGQLTGGIAHDFNNLLMAILGSLELMRKRLPDDPKLVALLDNATLGVERGSALTQRMLAFARRQDLVTGPVDLAQLVEGMRDLLERSLGPSIRIRVQIPRNLARARTDANQMEAALLNLAVNARDAMPNGGEIHISAGREPIERREGAGLPAGDYVRLSFRDTGAGMDPETLAKATEPFFTTKGLGKGTGLGLSMVHGIAEQSGGQLRLSSAPGQGTTADIWLPVAGPDEGARATGGAPTSQSLETPPTVVLAVDDDALVLLNTVAMLEDMGHGAIGAVSGAEALEILDRVGGVGLVVTDQAMPGMTGLQLAGEINRRWPDIPIVLATGYAELPVGAQQRLPRLPKPFSQLDLAEAVAAAMRPAGN